MALSLEEQTRIDLAVTFRIVAHLGMHEAVANHFSAAVSADGKQFLLNPKWKHFSRIRASDLLLLNADDPNCADHPNVDATAWSIHGQIHRLLPHTRAVLHLHPVYTTAVACLAKPHIPPIDQNTARYFNRVAVDELYGGMADTEAEGARLAEHALGGVFPSTYRRALDAQMRFDRAAALAHVGGAVPALRRGEVQRLGLHGLSVEQLSNQVDDGHETALVKNESRPQALRH